jgi:sec-independent protein translocase protein TatA
VTGGPMEIGLIIFAILVLFGYKKLPDASRSLGRSLRIFKGEMRGMKDDDRPEGTTQTRAADVPQPLRGEIGTPPTGAGLTEQSQAEARMAEVRAARARARADQAQSADGDR